MSEVTDISGRLNHLNDVVRAARVVKKNQRANDWSRVQRDHPDHAEFIQAMGQSFGKPQHVRVKTEAGEVILDSERYK